MRSRLVLGIMVAFAVAAATAVFAQTSTPRLPAADVVRITEFYRLAGQLQEQVWPGLSKVPTPLLLVTPDAEFLTHHPKPPREFTKVDEDLFARKRQFPVGLLATFPAFGPPSVIVIGEPENTEAETSTPWLFVVMHEHFHQLQDAQPGFFEAAENLRLTHGDNTGMWMLNYPFPYEKVELEGSFERLRDLLLLALNEPDGEDFEGMALQYMVERRLFFKQLSADDAKYLKFQLWKEGLARYVQIKSAELAARYQSTAEFAALPDYESFASYAKRARKDTLGELQRVTLAKSKRIVVYSLGAAEGLLLDRLDPTWKDGYFRHLFTLDPYFEK